MKVHSLNRVYYPTLCFGWVQRRLCGRRGASDGGEAGFTLVEVVMTMVVLSVGIMSLAPLMMAVVRGNRFAQDMTQATALAEDRIEETLHNPVYADITIANFPSEAQGQIRSGDPGYIKFARSVSIVDTLNVLGDSVMKNVTVTVSWFGFVGRSISVTLYGRVARF